LGWRVGCVSGGGDQRSQNKRAEKESFHMRRKRKFGSLRSSFPGKTKARRRR
jgi:hypothetical protein